MAAWYVHNSSEGPHMGPGSAERQSSLSLAEIVGHDACVVVRGASDIFSVVMVYVCGVGTQVPAFVCAV